MDKTFLREVVHSIGHLTAEGEESVGEVRRDRKYQPLGGRR